MKRSILAVAIAMAAGAASAQTNCQQVGTQTYCNGPGGSTTVERIGDFNYYNYSDPNARARGLPSSSQDIGNMRYYDNGASRQRTGDMDYYSNGTTRQRIGDTDYYSGPNGQMRSCQHIGNQTYCN